MFFLWLFRLCMRAVELPLTGRRGRRPLQIFFLFFSLAVERLFRQSATPANMRELFFCL